MQSRHISLQSLTISRSGDERRQKGGKEGRGVGGESACWRKYVCETLTSKFRMSVSSLPSRSLLFTSVYSRSAEFFFSLS